MSRRFGSLLLLLGSALLSNVALAAAPADKVQELQKDVDRVSNRLAQVTQNYENRRGLIGAVEAKIRYEDAVYDFLVGNYYEAANSFFVLVESEALTNPALHRDSQWYLAEALFELGNYETSAEAYGRIVDIGVAHPFFADAVRRQLEIFGILRDSKRFDDLYERYIVTGKVPATDLVKYTVAKSFYRQGGHDKAVELLNQIQPDSLYYARARYLVGVVYTAQGRLSDALPHFVAVSQLEPKNSLDRGVVELGTMAAARLYYETAQYALAAESYGKLTNESKYFADELYELVWTFIKQEEWSDAVRAIDTFLIAFPDHRYAMQLQLLRGHLHVKQGSFPDALVAYEGVIDAYTPIRDQVATINLDTEDPVAFFQRVADSGTIEVGGVALPPYATEMLFSSDTMERTRALHHDISSESADLRDSRILADEVQSVIASGSDAIGTFVWGRREIGGLRDEVLRLLAQTMTYEVAYLDDNLPDKMDPELDKLTADIDALSMQVQRAKSADTAVTDRNSVYEDQIRAVQNRAFKVQANARDLQAQAESVRTFLATSKVSSADRATVSTQLDSTQAELTKAIDKLDRLMGDTARRNLMTYVGGVAHKPAEGTTDRGRMLMEFTALQGRIEAYKSDVASADASSFFGSADKIWVGLTAVDGRAAVADANLTQTQARELTLLKEELARESANVANSTATLDRTSEAAAVLVANVARYGLGELQAEFNDAILRADMGIVDVYWLQKTGVSDDITNLYKDRATQLHELDQRYGMVQQKTSGAAAPTPSGTP